LKSQNAIDFDDLYCETIKPEYAQWVRESCHYLHWL
jgi:hypothetical protein